MPRRGVGHKIRLISSDLYQTFRIFLQSHFAYKSHRFMAHSRLATPASQNSPPDYFACHSTLHISLNNKSKDLLFNRNAEERSRTSMGTSAHMVLSHARLPIPPPRPSVKHLNKDLVKNAAKRPQNLHNSHNQKIIPIFYYRYSFPGTLKKPPSTKAALDKASF